MDLISIGNRNNSDIVLSNFFTITDQRMFLRSARLSLKPTGKIGPPLLILNNSYDCSFIMDRLGSQYFFVVCLNIQVFLGQHWINLLVTF